MRGVKDEKTLNFVIVGHLDHGKSTFIGRLLYDTGSLPPDKVKEIKKASKGLGKDVEFAYFLDYFEEERLQRMTIDTTQIFFTTARGRYVIIDAPGHREFVKNMVTGASHAEAAVLIIDVNEGVKEETRRQAYLLSLLGIKHVIVVLNKMDTVGFSPKRFNEVKEEVCGFLEKINIKPLIYIPVSSLYGDNIVRPSGNMNWYNGMTFLEAIDSLALNDDLRMKPFIFPVQDIYTVGDKRIIVGSIVSGKVKKGDRVKVFPSGAVSTVGSIEKFMEEVTEAVAGDSTGITVDEKMDIERGDVICGDNAHIYLTDAFSATVFWMSGKEVVPGEKLILRCATQEVCGRIVEIRQRIDSAGFDVIPDKSKIAFLDVADVVIYTEEPLVIKEMADIPEIGRFVLMRDQEICAGGIVRERVG